MSRLFRIFTEKIFGILLKFRKKYDTIKLLTITAYRDVKRIKDRKYESKSNATENTSKTSQRPKPSPPTTAGKTAYAGEAQA